MNWQGGRFKPESALRHMLALAALALLLPGLAPARAALQFDVFLGYDDLVREANWFPVACEIHNDGPGFTGVFELTSDQFGRGQVRRVVLELPTNTRKRFVIPVFGSGGRYSSWSARLLDQRGKVRAERLSLRPRREVSWEATVLGALPSSFSGLPRMPERRGSRNNDLEPEVARLQAEHFPDNAIALEGLDAIYLHADMALKLNVTQVDALLSWLAGGGHLIVGVDQPTGANAQPWLRHTLPAELTGLTTVRGQEGFEDWLKGRERDAPAVRRPKAVSSAARDPYRELAPDNAFVSAELPVATCLIRDGTTVLSSGGRPMIIEAQRGRGRVTLLTFNPEREPFRSWKNKGWFWAKLTNVAPDALAADHQPRYAYQCIDGVFGAMIDSKQVRKLPVSWLLLLLVVYLLVIGPVDQYSLEKINKQMFTWVTFPCYVAGFSLLIYWIGFMLRAGETEWNELHVVDVIPRGQKADLRGRTYGSIYSPSNARYRFGAESTDAARKHATMRGEYHGSWGGGQESSRGTVEQRGDGFEAEMFVPVWTSQLCVSDWLQSGEAPLRAAVRRKGGGFVAVIENKLPRTLKEVRLVVDDRVFAVGDVEGASSRTFEAISTGTGTRVLEFVNQHAGQFQQAVQQRQRAFGDSSGQRIANVPLASMAASFLSKKQERATPPQQFDHFIMPSRFEMSEMVDRGQAVLLAWDEGKPLIAPLNQFNPRRGSTQTLLRLAVPVEAAN